MIKKKPSSFRTDLRPPLIAGAAIGAVLLALLVLLAFMSEGSNPIVPPKHLPFYALALFAVHLLTVGLILGAYLARYRRISEANDAADLMTTEISDMFRYVVDIPYAIIGGDGMVKIVSGALQTILQFRSPICNVPLSDFCSVPMSEIIGYAQAGEQVKNLELKTGLCVATEELSSQPLTTRKEWNRASDRLLEIQKTWKTIGFAPKKDNNRIYERFRTACDRFFEAKRQFYAGMKTEMEHNLQLKIEICEAAESLMNSEEWKKATDELIALQARWKQIGAVSRRHSDAVWKRFRAACDKFFERKASHFASVDGEHEENLQKKLALLAEMAGADVKAGGYEVIREFQRRWGEIGFVPIKQKDAIQKKYKAAVDELFNTLRGSERDRSMGRFREKVSSFKASGDRRLRSERERLYNKVRQLEQEIGLLENNIGFFAKSKNAEALVADVRAKIERAREEMASTIEKVKLIDKQDQDENNNA